MWLMQRNFCDLRLEIKSKLYMVCLSKTNLIFKNFRTSVPGSFSRSPSLSMFSLLFMTSTGFQLINVYNSELLFKYTSLSTTSLIVTLSFLLHTSKSSSYCLCFSMRGCLDIPKSRSQAAAGNRLAFSISSRGCGLNHVRNSTGLTAFKNVL